VFQLIRGFNSIDILPPALMKPFVLYSFPLLQVNKKVNVLVNSLVNGLVDDLVNHNNIKDYLKFLFWNPRVQIKTEIGTSTFPLGRGDGLVQDGSQAEQSPSSQSRSSQGWNQDQTQQFHHGYGVKEAV
jgi:hypothetical protein